jgi:hypothetical protein
MTKRRLTSKALALTALLATAVMVAGAVCPVADAATTPRYIAGSISCLGIYAPSDASYTDVSSGLTLIGGSNGSSQPLTIRSNAPAVLAADATSYVDYQWFAWRSRIWYHDNLAGSYWLGDWSPWYYLRANDQTFRAAAFVDSNGAQLSGTPSYFDFPAFSRSGAATIVYYVANEVSVYNGSVWSASVMYDSRGYC